VDLTNGRKNGPVHVGHAKGGLFDDLQHGAARAGLG
jgi:hypothetical protein